MIDCDACASAAADDDNIGGDYGQAKLMRNEILETSTSQRMND
jgi:hypothetical protein